MCADQLEHWNSLEKRRERPELRGKRQRCKIDELRATEPAGSTGRGDEQCVCWGAGGWGRKVAMSRNTGFRMCTTQPQTLPELLSSPLPSCASAISSLSHPLVAPPGFHPPTLLLAQTRRSRPDPPSFPPDASSRSGTGCSSSPADPDGPRPLGGLPNWRGGALSNPSAPRAGARRSLWPPSRPGLSLLLLLDQTPLAARQARASGVPLTHQGTDRGPAPAPRSRRPALPASARPAFPGPRPAQADSGFYCSVSPSR